MLFLNAGASGETSEAKTVGTRKKQARLILCFAEREKAIVVGFAYQFGLYKNIKYCFDRIYTYDMPFITLNGKCGGTD